MSTITEHHNATFRCTHCGMRTATDDFAVIGLNCPASDFKDRHNMVPTLPALIHENGVVELHTQDPDATVCGTCGRAWDDTASTSVTPTPAGRCPFENDHGPSDLERLARAYADEVNKLEAGEWPAEYEADNYADEDAMSAWLDGVLEVYGDYRRSLGHDVRPELRTVGVLLAYGGPGCRLTLYADGQGNVRAYDMADEYVAHVYAPILADRLFELLEDYE